MAKLDIAEKRKPQDGKIRFRGPMGTIELRVATIPTSGGNEDVVMRILAASQAAAAREDGLLRAQPRPSSRRSWRSPTASAWWWAPPARARPPRCTPGLGYINTVDMKIWTAEDPVEITQAGPAPGAGAPEDRLHLRGGHARLPARRPRRDHGRRDARPRDRGHRHRGLAHRPPRVLHAAHQLGAGDDHPPARHGHRPLQLRGRAARASWPSAWCARSARTARRSTRRPRRSSRS